MQLVLDYCGLTVWPTEREEGCSLGGGSAITHKNVHEGADGQADERWRGVGRHALLWVSEAEDAEHQRGGHGSLDLGSSNLGYADSE